MKFPFDLIRAEDVIGDREWSCPHTDDGKCESRKGCRKWGCMGLNRKRAEQKVGTTVERSA